MTNPQAIYRYELKGTGETTELPKGAIVVDAVYQSERKAFPVYAMCNPEETEMVDRKFRILGTGEQFNEWPESVKFIRSIVMPDGFHVFHIIEYDCAEGI